MAVNFSSSGGLEFKANKADQEKTQEIKPSFVETKKSNNKGNKETKKSTVITNNSDGKGTIHILRYYFHQMKTFYMIKVGCLSYGDRTGILKIVKNYPIK